MIRAHLTSKQRAELFLAQGGRCAMCKEKMEKYEDDHWQALGRGGGNELSNRRLICIPCHKLKTFGRKHNRRGSDNYEAKKTARMARGKKEKKKVIKSPGFTGWRKFNGTLVRKES